MHHLSRTPLWIALLVAPLGFADAAHAGVRIVGQAKLHPTINAALAVAVPGDVLEVEPGEYVERVELAFDVTISGTRGSGHTTVRWDGAGREVIQVLPGANVLISGLTLASGIRHGMIADQATVTLVDIVANDLSTNSGGAAILAANTHLSITGSTFSDNATAAEGGAILLRGGSLTLDGVEMRRNSAKTGGHVAVTEGASVEVTRSTFLDGAAAAGGGIALFGSGSSASLSEITARGNQAVPAPAWPDFAAGGFLYADGYSLSLQDCQIAANTGEIAGAIRQIGAGLTFEVEGCEVFDNTDTSLDDHAGAMFVEGAPFVRGSVFHGNRTSSMNATSNVQVLRAEGSFSSWEFVGNVSWNVGVQMHIYTDQHATDTSSHGVLADNLFMDLAEVYAGPATYTVGRIGEVRAYNLTIEGNQVLRTDNAHRQGGWDLFQASAGREVLFRNNLICGANMHQSLVQAKGTNFIVEGNLLVNNQLLSRSAFHSTGVYRPDAMLIHNTFIGNHSVNGATSFRLHESSPLVIYNNLLAWNTGGPLIEATGGGPLFTHNNLFWENDGDFIGPFYVNYDMTADGNIEADPLLVDWQPDYDCGTGQPWPSWGSPAVNAGLYAPDPDGTAPDIGAYGGAWPMDPDLFIDADGDGFIALYDCDDADPLTYPGADEYCDGRDNDCNGVIDDDAVDADTWYPDADGDGYGDASFEGLRACEQPAGMVLDHQDCDDTDPAVNPDAIEVCDGIDNDCDGTIDGPDAIDAEPWYLDADGDGWGIAADVVMDCEAPAGRAAVAGDCDDTNAAVHPGALEICNGIDDNCDGQVDVDAVDAPTWYPDLDADGYGADAGAVVSCIAPPGHVAIGGDCDDSQPAAFPGNPEICDGIDNDCNGVIDDDMPWETYWLDADGDGYGDPYAPVEACVQPPNAVSNADDCDDTEPLAWTGAAEVCDGVDNDCDGQVDPPTAVDAQTFYVDADGDGYGDPTQPVVSCPPAPEGTVDNADDCDDTDDSIHPGAHDEPGDGIDQDCSGADAEEPSDTDAPDDTDPPGDTDAPGDTDPPDGTDAPDAPADGGDERGGCGCDQTGPPGAPLLALLLAFAVQRRRRAA